MACSKDGHQLQSIPMLILEEGVSSNQTSPHGASGPNPSGQKAIPVLEGRCSRIVQHTYSCGGP
jgi:hypothetical protein